MVGLSLEGPGLAWLLLLFAREGRTGELMTPLQLGEEYTFRPGWVVVGVRYLAMVIGSIQ